MLKNAFKKHPLQNRTNVQIKGGGVKGLLNNVKKNCTFLKWWLPYGHRSATNNSSELRYSISKQLFCLWWNTLNKQNSSQEEFSLFRGSWRWGHGKSCLLKYHTNAGCGVLVHCPSFKYFLPKLDWFFKLNSQWSRFQLYFLNIRLYFFKSGAVPHLLVF